MKFWISKDISRAKYLEPMRAVEDAVDDSPSSSGDWALRRERLHPTFNHLAHHLSQGSTESRF
jgi:hypothetical protein